VAAHHSSSPSFRRWFGRFRGEVFKRAKIDHGFDVPTEPVYDVILNDGISTTEFDGPAIRICGIRDVDGDLNALKGFIQDQKAKRTTGRKTCEHLKG
jgi:hypothetical protein